MKENYIPLDSTVPFLKMHTLLSQTYQIFPIPKFQVKTRNNAMKENIIVLTFKENNDLYIVIIYFDYFKTHFK